MINTFPYDEWGPEVTDFWTWGGANSTGTYVLTALGCILMVAAIIGFFVLEKRKLDAQAATLRASGAFGMPAPEPPPAG